MKIFTKACCDTLLGFSSNTELEKKYFYEFDNRDFSYLNFETEISVDDEMVLNPSSDKDFENSVKVFEHFKTLDRVQANDKRLWVTLTHTYFFEYTKKRWNFLEGDSHDKIISRFHFEGASLETRMRNSISRLWWAAKLTYDSDRQDPYELTKVLWSKQDIFQNLVERSYGTYDSVVKGFLEFYSNNKHLSENQLRSLFTALNSIGGVKVLSVHDKKDIINTLYSLSEFYGYSLAA